MKLSPAAYRRFLFVVLCVTWGTTWFAMKVGALSLPPAFFSGTRWIAAGVVLLVWSSLRGAWLRVDPGMFGRLAAVAILMVTLNQTLMLYSLRYVGSGLAAVINSAFTPISLLGFGVALKQEAFTLRQGIAIAIGVAGLALLFGPGIAKGEVDGLEMLGALGVVAGCLCYCGGSVLARPLMTRLPPTQLAAVTNLLGGATLLATSLAFEPGSFAALSGQWGGPAWLAWIYMLLFGSLIGAVIFLILVRDWGASRAGNYAFVSPVIAVGLGTLLYTERLDALDAAGMALMLCAALLALRAPNPARAAAK